MFSVKFVFVKFVKFVFLQLELKAMIEEATEKQKRLEMNIVTSPDRILNDIAHMEEELQTCISKRADLESVLRVCIMTFLLIKY